jgi:peptide/nickel transport system permease protein
MPPTKRASASGMCSPWRVRSCVPGAGRGYLSGVRHEGGIPENMSDAVISIRPQGPLARLLRRKLAVVGLVLIALVVLGAIFAPWLVAFAPDAQLFDGLTIEGAPLPPGGAYLLGTDLLGRDLWSRILYGARTSLVIGLVANGIALAIGTAVGITAGYFRGWMGRC